MIRLIPEVKELKTKNGQLRKKAIYFENGALSARLSGAAKMLPFLEDGVPFSVEIADGDGEGYLLDVCENEITVKADGEAGAFYAIQTLRQIFEEETVPCLTVKDYPDFKYRGIYQDITRGKIPTVDTLKRLIDMAAYYKINVLQLYVEHVYDFIECREINTEGSYVTADELRELDEYCKERFIDFQPSLSTFGHMFEILNMPKHRHLSVLKDYENNSCRWIDRHAHHTIDPELDESFELVKSLIDQYAPNFTSDYFNICCDETFDLKSGYPEEREAELYVSFVKKIIDYVKSKGKKVMMWADIILKHTDKISELPDDVILLNWYYRSDPPENNVAIFKEYGRPQIVCPGTGSWLRFCEKVETEEANVTKLIDLAYKYGALGALTTNWGDWGNPASIESASYGLVLGAAKSWAVSTKADEEFHEKANALLYHFPKGFEYLCAVSDAHGLFDWQSLIRSAHLHRDGLEYKAPISASALEEIQSIYKSVAPALKSEAWEYGDFKEELLIALEAICVSAELGAKLSGLDFVRLTDTESFFSRYSAKWLEKNKSSDLWRIEEILRYMDSI